MTSTLHRSSASSPTASGSTADTGPDEAHMFVRHTLTTQDNLAGLAVKYNVTVSDIKRANGFLSDSAMFGKETLLIPTRPVPIGPEYSAWAGMIGVHYGRHAAGRAHSALGGGCHSAALSELRGYYSTGASLATSPGFSDDEDEAGPGRRRGRPSEVELMARQHGGFSHGSPSADDRLRRRTYCEDGFGAPGASTPPPAQRPPLFGAGSEGRALLGAAMPDLRDLQRRSARWKDQVLSRLKRVASQPTLAPATSLGQAADAAITSMLAGPPAGSSVAQHAQQLMYNAATAQRPKDGGKAD